MGTAKFRASLRVHQIFNFIGFDRDVGHQINRTIFRDQDIVFESNGETFIAKVNGGFNGHHPTGLHWLCDETEIVNIEPKRMADAVHKIFFHGR